MRGKKKRKDIAVRAHKEDSRGASRKKRGQVGAAVNGTRAQMLVSSTRPVPSAIFSRMLESDSESRSVCFRCSRCRVGGCVRSHGAQSRAVKLCALWRPPWAGGVFSVHVFSQPPLLRILSFISGLETKKQQACDLWPMFSEQQLSNVTFWFKKKRKHCILRRIASTGGFLFNLKIVSILYKEGL